ncbi:hypothetical protein BRC88_03305 [Halobacteriales archaeon QS_4_69_225]|nr:MAG: hypothetical protein BRC88_03305 [Halobacteriales archaeon QS_4_69_225]
MRLAAQPRELDADVKTARFLEAYLSDFDGGFDYITYEWQTHRYPVDAEVQGDVRGDFTLQTRRSDVINDHAMYSDDRDARKLRAEYIHSAVDGRKVKSGGEPTVPVPRSDDGVEKLLSHLDNDRDEVAATNAEELERVVNDAVYEIFGITPSEQNVIEEFLETFWMC